ncbi:hypothetical protein HQ394_12215 [Defluviicoccus vanus]|uniref:Uncharacterized protein n=1 Tax=Defluviicoccus vanus TaxID=111831 RepID=A0A7H1N2L6_9PROT|nr:hypothetical protein HQ394_12215 [Defluviicoccus vanus]
MPNSTQLAAKHLRKKLGIHTQESLINAHKGCITYDLLSWDAEDSRLIASSGNNSVSRTTTAAHHAARHCPLIPCRSPPGEAAMAVRKQVAPLASLP